MFTVVLFQGRQLSGDAVSLQQGLLYRQRHRTAVRAEQAASHAVQLVWLRGRFFFNDSMPTCLKRRERERARQKHMYCSRS